MEIVGNYEYSNKDLIGHGAFAVVFKGRLRKVPDQTVAIKCIAKKKIGTSQNLLKKEIKILKELSGLHHENVVQLMECQETTEHVYLIMEYCNGGDLAEYLQAKVTLSEDTISHFLKHIAAAMKALNTMDIVHRDMKPQNILLCLPPGVQNPPPSEITLKIADFGLARFLQDGVMAGTLCGSPMYMAPEVIMSLQYDAKADLWSIGTIVFQCLTGKAPFQAQTPPQLKQIYEKSLELKPNIPLGTSPELKDLLLKLLKRNAKERIEFDDFFVHPFVNPPLPTLSSSPVPMPCRYASSSSSSSASLKANSDSPVSGNMECSPSPPVVQWQKPKTQSQDKKSREQFSQVATAGSSKKVADFLKTDKEREANTRSRTLTEDFVMVPEVTGSDQSDGDESKVSADEGFSMIAGTSNTVTVTHNSGVKLLQKDSSANFNICRPLSLQIMSPVSTPPSYSLISVPGQVAAYQRMQYTGSSPSSPSNHQKTMDSNSSVRREPERKESSLSHQGSSLKINNGELSPPVQFTIGTPPGISVSPGSWRRDSISNSPKIYGTTLSTPLRRSGSVPGQLSPIQQYSGPGFLPTITDLSLTKFPSIIHYPPNLNELPSGKVGNGVVLRHNSYTVPENLQALEFTGNETRTVIPFAGLSSSHKRINTGVNDVSERYAGYTRQKSVNVCPPHPTMFIQSPANMEGPIMLVAPTLSEETVMDENHNTILVKLNFTLDLVECILDVAKSRGAPLSSFSESKSCTKGQDLQESVPKSTESQRRLEQLILHVRGLHLLSSALQLARDEIKSGRLTISNSVKNVVKQMNEHYHNCVTVSRQLLQRLSSTVQTALSPQIVIATADKLIYNYAIEMCQTAALDELFGNSHECFLRYQTAQILLHSLVQQVGNSRDRESLNKYKVSVEKRLSNLQGGTFYHLSGQADNWSKEITMKIGKYRVKDDGKNNTDNIVKMNIW